jgi:hypothetical protein
MTSRQNNAMIFNILLAILCLGVAFPCTASAGITASYLYSLSNFNGTIPYSWVKHVVDRQANEIYVVTGDTVSIFNDKGMEIYRFGADLDLGVLADAAVRTSPRSLPACSPAGWCTATATCTWRTCSPSR